MVLGCFQSGDDCCQRAAQFVRGVADEAFLRTMTRFDSCSISFIVIASAEISSLLSGTGTRSAKSEAEISATLLRIASTECKDRRTSRYVAAAATPTKSVHRRLIAVQRSERSPLPLHYLHRRSRVRAVRRVDPLAAYPHVVIGYRIVGHDRAISWRRSGSPVRAAWRGPRRPV